MRRLPHAVRKGKLDVFFSGLRAAHTSQT